jgi:RNA recognition motif-containing protein
VGRRLYVGNLPYSATEGELSETFSQIGTVAKARIVLDRESGRSKGFAFIEMATDEEASMAIEKLNGFSHGGRAMIVNEARPQAPRFERGT